MKVLEQLADAIDAMNRRLGRLLGWAVLLLILAQFAIIVLTNVFRVGSIQLQESLLYANSLIFLGAAGYTLLRDEQVRVDIFYRGAPKRFKARVNLFGTLFLLFPVMGLLGVSAWPYVAASWAVLEGSTETTGLQAVFILKSFLLLFTATLTLQGVSLAIRSWIELRHNSGSES